MSADHLPEDLRRWPRDPYQILGVSPNCDALEARKAYSSLIRHFKPEQFPEHFRLIRQAYDAVKRNAQYRELMKADAAADIDSPNPPANPALFPIANTPGAPDLLQILWDQACNGKEVEAYGKMREMYEVNPHGSELPARLYALLLANPELDPRRSPCDWLVRGVRSEPHWGPCRQLYWRELHDHPGEALRDRFLALLDQTVPARNIIGFLSWRWEALVHLERTHLIAGDLKRVAPRLEHEDEEGFVRVLLKAADYLAWQRDSRFEELCRNIESHVHLHAALAGDLSRLDFLHDLSKSWHKLPKRSGPASPLLRVVPLAWTSPFDNRQAILTDCRAAAENPKAALDQLDEVMRHAPLIPTHLAQSLSQLSQGTGDPRDQEIQRSVIADHLQGLQPPTAPAAYALYRRHLLHLCLTEFIAPETVAHMLNPTAPFAVQWIYDDGPLRTVCWAHRLIWE